MADRSKRKDERVKSAHDLAVEWSQSTEEGSVISTADIDRLAIVINYAATRMRDRCVEKVKSLWTTSRGNEYNGALNDVLRELQSLTLEGEQEQ